MNSIDLTPDISRSIFGLVESINELTEILNRLGFWSLFFLAVFGVLLLYRHFKESPAKKAGEGFDPGNAEQLFLRGNIDELIAYCDEYHEAFPNDVWISWYRALGHYNRGRYDEAKLWFDKVMQINPGFGPDIEPYVAEIDNASSGEPRH